MGKLILLFLFQLVSLQILSQSKLIENFDYPAGDSITVHGWNSIPGPPINRILVTSPGLSYPEYPLSGLGNAVTLATTGQDVYRTLSDTTSSGAVYASFMVRVTNAVRPGDYVAAFLPSNSSSFFSGRVNVRLRSGFVEFGLTKASLNDTNSMVWISGFSLNTTYLIILKYVFLPGTSNDPVSLFIFPAGLPFIEPPPIIGPINFSATSTDAINIGRFSLRQGTTGRAPNIIIDGILVSSSWFVTFSFYQSNFNYGGNIQNNSDWGGVEISHKGFSSNKYLNVAINASGITTQWQVQNSILINSKEPGITQNESFDFDIGDAGIDVANIQYGITITDVPLVVQPAITSNANVQDVTESVYSGINTINPDPPLIFDPAGPLISVTPTLDIYYHKNFPNQNCGKRECAPAGISNSLYFLNKKFNLMIDSLDITIEKMKTATNFVAGIGPALNWATLKKEYMEKNNLPITTRIKTFSNYNTQGFMDSVKKEIENGQDVEMWVSGATATDTFSHVVNLIGIGNNGDGTWKLKTSEDIYQENSGGNTTIKETTYDSATSKFKEGHLSKHYNRGIPQIVIECPNYLLCELNAPANNEVVDEDSVEFSWTCTNCDSIHPVTYWLEVAEDTLFTNKIIDIRDVPNDNFIPPPSIFQGGQDYFWRVRVNDSVGPGSYASIFKFNTLSNSSMFIVAAPEGMYIPAADTMTSSDSIKVYLRQTFIPYSISDSGTGVINKNNLTAQVYFTNGVPGVYYVVVRSRNTIETWSKFGVSIFFGPPVSYDFTVSASQAFGNNLILKGSRYCIYSGDVNQDGVVDGTDASLIDNDASNFVTGYLVTDLNGDEVVDGSDASIADNNAANFVVKIIP